jgi:NodT family efflux transporter outer membrane factor (OMF) lipoprotein
MTELKNSFNEEIGAFSSVLVYREIISFMLKKMTLCSCLLLSACMVGPDYKEPQMQVAAHWPKKDASIKEKPFHDYKWWEVFRDPTLTNLINQSYHDNLPVQIAGVRVLQARAQLAQSAGELYPQQQAMTGDYTYTRLGGSSFLGLLPTNFDSGSLGFTANWELDFWGKYRRAIQANDAAFLASVAAYDNALITLTADVAKTYVKIRTYESQIRVTNENIKVQRMSLKIAQSRFKAGQVSLVDVEQAKTELAQTQSSLPSLISNLQTQKDALAVLLGTIPNGIDSLLKKNKGIPRAPYSVAVGIPKETLARRPDIHQARLEAVSQAAAIGAIKAELYPALSLAGTFSFSATNIGTSSVSDMFNWANRSITAGPNLAWSLLNYGQITNSVRMQDAAFQQSLLNYVNLVLKAQQEVQDSITSYIEAKSAAYYLTQANASATKSLKLALVRYTEGETDFTPVLNAEQQLLSVALSLVNAQGDIPQALIALYRALGGGWQIRGHDDVVPDSIKKQMAARTNWGTLLKQQSHMPPVTKAQEIQQLYLPKW